MPGEHDYLCDEHSGVRVRLKNLEKKVNNQCAKMASMYARVNIILGSACCSLVLIIVDLVLRINKVK